MRDDQPEILTREEAAKLLRVCTHTITKLAKAGKLPGRKLGHEWRFSRSEILRWLSVNSAA
jgi:excisionase family DNA binding protein